MNVVVNEIDRNPSSPVFLNFGWVNVNPAYFFQ
jgi:hypothetical protein